MWSQTDCLMVGAQFHTPATFATSLDCVCQQLMEGIRSNEDATSKDWINLNTFIQFLDDKEVFTEKESGHAYDSLRTLMTHPQLQSFWNDLSREKKAIRDFRATARALLKEKKRTEK